LTLIVRAPAKVNLDLRVLGVRADGFHELRTVFQSIAVHDTLVCTESAGPFALLSKTPGVPLDESNTIWRAATALWKALGREGAVQGVTIRIDKNVPLEAGLGGGSADAAAALAALARMWRPSSDRRRGADPAALALLRDIGAEVGADVPFCLFGGTALGLGRGEEIYPLVDLPQYFAVVSLPPFGVSTREAYAWYDEDRAAGLREHRELQQLPVPWPSRAAQMINDLEPPVVRRHPEIVSVKAQLKEAGAIAAAMTGSGSAVFGLFRTRASAERAARSLAHGGQRAFVTRTLTRAAHERLTHPVARRRAVVRRSGDAPQTAGRVAPTR
jgi:4-diphosphocytidyl-2-C-methyl-D-erythritol kinase